MESPQLALLGEQSEGKGRDVHDFQVRELLQRIPRGQVKEEPGEISLQQWEVQWQEFLKTLDSPQIQLPTSALSEEPSPWSDPKAFLASFEQVAKACQWPRETWVAQLLPALQGESERALFGVETGDREDYGKVKMAILREDAIRREKHRQHFRLFCYREAEDLRAVCSQLQELCHRWLEVERHSKEQILELLVLEQFMTILPPEIQNQVREHGPETCAQAVTLAEDFILGQQEKRRQTSQVTLEESTLSLGEADQVPSVMEQTHLHEKNKQEEKEGEPDLLGAVWHCEAEGESQGFSLETIPPPEVEEASADQVGLKWLPGKDLGLLEEQRNKSIAIRQSFRQLKTKKCKKCPVCGKMLSSKSGLQVHQKVHTGEKPYKCSECGKSFTQVSNLMSHKKIHTGERPYRCTECGKHFGRKNHLKSHWRTHTGEKPYACLECGKCFSECTYLTKHKRIHTGEKPYNCLECEKCFTRSDHLASHQKMHAERKTWKRKKLLPKVNPPSCP